MSSHFRFCYHIRLGVFRNRHRTVSEISTDIATAWRTPSCCGFQFRRIRHSGWSPFPFRVEFYGMSPCLLRTCRRCASAGGLPPRPWPLTIAREIVWIGMFVIVLYTSPWIENQKKNGWYRVYQYPRLKIRVRLKSVPTSSEKKNIVNPSTSDNILLSGRMLDTNVGEIVSQLGWLWVIMFLLKFWRQQSGMSENWSPNLGDCGWSYLRHSWLLSLEFYCFNSIISIEPSF